MHSQEKPLACSLRSVERPYTILLVAAEVAKPQDSRRQTHCALCPQGKPDNSPPGATRGLTLGSMYVGALGTASATT